MQGNYTCDMSELLRQQTEKANLLNKSLMSLEESLPVIEKATAGTEKDARPGIFFLYASCSGGYAPPKQAIT